MDSGLILEIKNLDLSYKAHLYHTRSLRDVFIKAAKKPYSILDHDFSLEVLKNINLKVKKGDRIGILGHNGAGKTTLCRCIAGIYDPTKGQVHLHGKVRAVFDTMIGVYPELTGRENAEIMAQFMYPELIFEHEQIVEDALSFSELGTFTDLPFKNYSNGMQTRLCLSLVSARSPDLLILDEVFDGADQFFQEKIAARVMKMIQGSGAALFVSHSTQQVMNVCNRVVVLHDSKIHYDGAVEKGIQIYSDLRPHSNIRNVQS